MNFRKHGQYPHYRLCPISTEELPVEFQFQRLSEKRNKADFLFLYKVLNKKIDCSKLLEKIDFFIPGRLTRSKQLFFIPRYKTEIYKRSPLQRMFRMFNEFDHLDPFQYSLHAFKQLIWIILFCFIFTCILNFIFVIFFLSFMRF